MVWWHEKEDCSSVSSVMSTRGQASESFTISSKILQIAAIRRSGFVCRKRCAFLNLTTTSPFSGRALEPASARPPEAIWLRRRASKEASRAVAAADTNESTWICSFELSVGA